MNAITRTILKIYAKGQKSDTRESMKGSPDKTFFRIGKSTTEKIY